MLNPRRPRSPLMVRSRFGAIHTPRDFTFWARTGAFFFRPISTLPCVELFHSTILKGTVPLPFDWLECVPSTDELPAAELSDFPVRTLFRVAAGKLQGQYQRKTQGILSFEGNPHGYWSSERRQGKNRECPGIFPARTLVL